MCRFWSCAPGNFDWKHTFCQFCDRKSPVLVCVCVCGFFLWCFFLIYFFNVIWFSYYSGCCCGSHGSPSRPRWRLALGGAQLDPATPVAQLTVEDLVKLCNALGQLQPAGEKKGGRWCNIYKLEMAINVISKSKVKYDSHGVWKIIVCYK